MNPATSSIERLIAAARKPHGPWLPAGLALGVLGGASLLGINRNLLYLSLLLSAGVILSFLLTRRWTAAVGLGACAYLGLVPAGVEDLGALYPAPRDIPGAENMWVSPVRDGETWTYRFTLGAPEGRAEGAGPGHLYIDGRGLSDLVVSVQGKTLMGSAFCSRKNGLDHLAIPLEGERSQGLTVSLWGARGATPRIFHGPEAHGFNLYGDAVWLEFEGGGVRAVYHAQRAAAGSARPCGCGRDGRH